jgi:hypothetical protein
VFGINGFLTLSIVGYSKYMTFRNLDLFPSSGEGGDTYCAGSLRKDLAQFFLKDLAQFFLKDPTQ